MSDNPKICSCGEPDCLGYKKDRQRTVHTEFTKIPVTSIASGPILIGDEVIGYGISFNEIDDVVYVFDTLTVAMLTEIVAEANAKMNRIR